MTHAPIRILAVEDDTRDAVHLRRLLREGLTSSGLDFRHLVTAENLEDQLASFRPDIIFLDYRLGADDGIRILTEVTARHPDLPAIMITGYGDEEVAVNALHAGAIDYLPKSSLSRETLVRAVFRALAVSRYAATRRAAEALAATTIAHEKAFFSVVPVPAVRLDRHGGIVALNASAAHTLGWAPERVVGNDLHDLVHRLLPDENRSDPYDCPVLEALRGDEEMTAVHDAVCQPDGGFRHGAFHFIRTPGRPDLGQLVLFEPDARDHARADREALRRESREMSDAINVISHLVKTPMTPVKLQIALLRRRLEGDDAARDALDVVERNLRRMGTLFDNAINTLRLKRGELRIHWTEADLADVCRGAAKDSMPLQEERAVAVQGVFHPARAKVDAKRLREAIRRLLETAVARSSPGAIVQFSLTQDGQRARIEIADTGPPLSADQKRAILDPFGILIGDTDAGSQVEQALHTHYARILVEANGGRMDLESGHTTRVTIELPLAATSAASGAHPDTEGTTEESRAEPAPADASPASAGRPPRPEGAQAQARKAKRTAGRTAGSGPEA